MDELNKQYESKIPESKVDKSAEVDDETKKMMDEFFYNNWEEISKVREKSQEELDIENIQSIVVDAYTTILNRTPDAGSLKHYTNMLKFNAINKEKLYEILKNSDEYKKRMKFDSVDNRYDINRHKENKEIYTYPTKLIYCMMGTNRLHEFKNYIPIILPYVDKFIFIDGLSNDGTVDYFKNLKSFSEENNDKIEFHIYEWQDRFSAQRNIYLEKVKNISSYHEERNEPLNLWILTSDTDEHFPIETLEQLRNLIDKSTTENYNGIMFQVEDIMVDDDNYNKILSRSINNKYWKPLMFKYDKNIHYEGEPHETLVGARFKWKKVSYLYEHYRNQKKVYERACENFFISNSNRYSPKWADFRWLCTKNNILVFKDFFNLYKEGTIPKEVEEWIIEHRDDDENDGDSEIRELYKLYYEIYHPEKLPLKIKDSTKTIKDKTKTEQTILRGDKSINQKPEMSEYIKNEPKKEYKEKDICIYEKLLPNECYILNRVNDKFLVLSNKNGQIEIEYLKIPEVVKTPENKNG